MKSQTVALAGAMILLAGVAIAQTATPSDAPRPLPTQPQGMTPPPPPPPPPQPPEQMGGHYSGGRGGPGGPGGPDGMRMGGRGPYHGRMGSPMGPPMGKGPLLKVDGDGGFFLKCADEDTTRSCLEAAGPVLEKIIARPVNPR